MLGTMNVDAAEDLQPEGKPDAALPLRKLARALARIAALAPLQQSQAPAPSDGNAELQPPIGPTTRMPVSTPGQTKHD